MESLITFRPLVLLTALLLLCTDGFCRPERSVPYRELKGCLVRPAFKGRLAGPKITGRKQLDRVFHPAPAVNFRKEYVIAVVNPRTKLETAFRPRLLRQDVYGRLRFYVDVRSGGVRKNAEQPCLLIAVDRKYNGPVTLELKNVP